MDDDLLAEMAQLLSVDERDEMAIPSYRHKNPLLRWMAWRRVEVLINHMETTVQSIPRLQTGRAVMDFGCGTGVFFPAEAACFDQIYGVDLALGAAQLHLQKRTYPSTAIKLCQPEEAQHIIPDHSLDIIVAAEVLEHISPLDDTLDFFWRKLRGDGRLLITVPTENRLYQFGRKLSGFEKHFHVDHAASIHSTIQSRRFQSLKIAKIPFIAPFDIYWLVEYKPDPI
ncbi:MAG: class I SAM-dependent methyltransferase [Ardenticatenaceae bacterium]|nr:class I SAM-dependent methyltransferase [Ardenticatenaceae bacterium]MCB8991965.1 class I SAM-dependent methyltransferase [Ardenticatenaceae bacterium]MCB9004904.1 class I SAM-dependent methyltransferase [Ardenticatenaceae bacterium]